MWIRTSLIALLIICGTCTWAQYQDHPVPQYPEQWGANWITHREIEKTAHCLVHFRNIFELGQQLDKFIIQVSDDNRYWLSGR